MNGAFPKVVFAGGGTGGHVIPAIAAAREIVQMGGSARFVGSADRLEARLVPLAGFGIDFIRVRPLVGEDIKGVFTGLVLLPSAVAQAAFLLKRLRPNVVLGVGGYVAGPVVMAARLIGLKTALLEQNATVGLTNQLLARFVDKAFIAYEETAAAFPASKIEVTGNPVSRDIAKVRARRIDRAEGLIHILVTGGSQGARDIDRQVPVAMKEAALWGCVTVLHQCNRRNLDWVASSYRDAGIEAEVVPFIDDMAGAYARADLVIGRAGATTVAELTAVGLPAVFLPYPHHSDNQQARNAAAMVRADAAILLDGQGGNSSEMARAINAFVRDADRRRQASEAAAALGKPDAAAHIAEHLHRLARGGP
ncbi:MAG: undecaprenyldiphospho-muramoylpentapeptide beta-N-acetylglucosaminyltransferase [Myxococcota bacterium]|nr:undecaprenyldiphospho-muramoylpentapeptide beta-N-acetylglucosaminyltransferase [Myxococcota bacterium]